MKKHPTFPCFRINSNLIDVSSNNGLLNC